MYSVCACVCVLCVRSLETKKQMKKITCMCTTYMHEYVLIFTCHTLLLTLEFPAPSNAYDIIFNANASILYTLQHSTMLYYPVI